MDLVVNRRISQVINYSGNQDNFLGFDSRLSDNFPSFVELGILLFFPEQAPAVHHPEPDEHSPHFSPFSLK